ncbi:Inner kinetochore subunit MCM21 [Nakaseomyces bracarensis]|uniref:Inner kinetochore subunit MCM21 n=1 Tax=Nakaseomyces bracarensis TaxID=273131 RepID=A0ABR4NYY5_9SACH
MESHSIMESNTVEELEQDIEALNAEVRKLKEKSAQLRAQLKHPERFVRWDNNDERLDEFHELFNANPELRELLLGYEAERSVEVVEDTSKPQTPRKKAKTSPSKNLNDLPEHEWVLNTQPLVQHKLFDNGVSDLIDTEILISPSKRKQKIKPSTSNQPGREILEPILHENIYRMFGISYFPVVDPNDLEYDKDRKIFEVKRNMIGIRFDIFNQFNSKFEKPHYILLKNDSKSNKWNLFKYTIPNYIDVEGIYKDTNGGIITNYDDIYIFAKQINILLIQLSLRSQILLQLEEDKLIEKLDMDLQATIVSFSKSHFKFELILKESSILSCTLKNNYIPSELKTSIEILLHGPLDELGKKLEGIDFEAMQ